VTSTRITEVKTTLAGERQRFECERIHYAAGEAVILYRMPADHQLEDLLLPKDSRSLGYFWETRAYNAYHWVDDNRHTLALYFNICDNTRISQEQVAWRDLTVDVLITPDLRCRVLDEDELPDDLEPDLLAHIDTTRDALCANPARLLQQFESRSRTLLAGD
jgi:predicted RNA-binding protein associated with RNAse of E/G family